MSDNDTSHADQVMHAALAYARQGYRVLPLRPGTKIPALPAWTAEATTDAEVIADWFTFEYAGYNLGLATGRASNLWVLDIDTGHGPDARQSLDALVEEFGTEWMATRTVVTPSGSSHLWYTWPSLQNDDDGSTPTWRNIASGILGRGIDVRAEGGQVAVWPSVLADGTLYDIPLGNPTPPPTWLAERTRFRERTTTGKVVSLSDLSGAAQDAASRYAVSAVGGVLADLKGLTDAKVSGSLDSYKGDPWDSTCYARACRLIELANADWAPVDLDSAEVLFSSAAPTDAGFTDSDHDRIWKSALRNVGDRPAVLPDLQRSIGSGTMFGTPMPPTQQQVAASTAQNPTVGPATRTPTDLRSMLVSARGQVNLDVLALLVADADLARGTDNRYWVYTAGVWRPDDSAVTRRAIREVGGLWRHGHLATLEEHLASDAVNLALVGNDTHAGLINTRSGMIDWATGNVLAHDPDYRSTIQLPVDYDPSATCPAFDRWLAQVFPPAVLPRVWEVIGYMLLNGNPLQSAFLLYGPGNNGKSTLIRVLQRLIGRHNTSAVTLRAMANNDYSVANLHGAQANLAGDIEAKYLNDTSTFKALTGGDEVTVRRIYRDPFKFVCHATPMFSANEMWRSADTTPGYMRRWTMVPMPYNVAEVGSSDFREPDLYAEVPGILNGALEGLRRVMGAGRFSESEESRLVKADFEMKSDLVATWLTEDEAILEAMPNSEDRGTWVPRQDIYARFSVWCRQNGHDRPMSSGKFYGRLRTLEYATQGRPGRVNEGGGRGFLGFRIDATAQGYDRNRFPSME